MKGVHGPYQPEAGLRFNPARLLIDPYAKAMAALASIPWEVVLGTNAPKLAK